MAAIDRGLETLNFLPDSMREALRVLIVEDYAAQRAALMHVVTQLGMQAVVAATGEEGLTQLSAAAREDRLRLTPRNPCAAAS